MDSLSNSMARKFSLTSDEDFDVPAVQGMGATTTHTTLLSIVGRIAPDVNIVRTLFTRTLSGSFNL